MGWMRWSRDNEKAVASRSTEQNRRRMKRVKEEGEQTNTKPGFHKGFKTAFQPSRSQVAPFINKEKQRKRKETKKTLFLTTEKHTKERELTCKACRQHEDKIKNTRTQPATAAWGCSGVEAVHH